MTKSARTLCLRMLLTAVLMHISGWGYAGSTSLYVANEDNGTVRQFSQSGTDLGNFATGLNAPAYITSNSAGDLFVSNFGGNSVQEYSPQGTLLMTIATPFQPGDALVTASGTLLVADYFGGSIYQYSSTGQSLGLFSNPGLVRADFMTLDAQGNLYVTDFMSGVVRKISPTGGDEGNFLTNVQGIEGIAFDSHGNLYAAFQAGMIKEYNASGQYLGLITSTGLDLPYGITFGPDSNLYVANAGNNTIHEFSPSGTDLGVFASTGMDAPRALVFSSAVPEPAGFLLMAIGVTIVSGPLVRRLNQARRIGP